jgi:hypothetical protein
MLIEGGESCWEDLASFQCFAYSSTAMSLGDKWTLPFNSACLKGTETTFLGVLIVDGDGDRGGEVYQVPGGIVGWRNF